MLPVVSTGGPLNYENPGEACFTHSKGGKWGKRAKEQAQSRKFWNYSDDLER